MKALFLLTSLVLSSVFLSACSGGQNLFWQSVKKTAPKTEKIVQESFAPVDSEFIDPYGEVLTTLEGKALYTFEQDSFEKSNCNDECAIVWPPLLTDSPDAVSGVYGVIKRKEEYQVTSNGQPLYTYTPDVAHIVSGDGKDGRWNVVLVDQEQ